MEARVESAISMGKGVFAALPSRADAVDALLAKHFAMSVPAFRAAARASCVPRKSNAELVRTQEAVHELLVGGAADMRALECWLLTRVPQVSDGNNFGAEVQHFVLEQLQKSRAQLSGLTELMTAYLKARGEASEKLGPAKSSESTTAESAESKTEEGVAKESSVKKTEKSEKSVTKEEVEDLQHHVVELDVKQYGTRHCVRCPRCLSPLPRPSCPLPLCVAHCHVPICLPLNNSSSNVPRLAALRRTGMTWEGHRIGRQ
mmetsp:Transcript_20560/g.52167  ORF Transcript_20560/g.52167 Transcript_20560/m.52167 type:complete len:260 (+) Transcript_20560:31-810(+)